MQITKVKPVKKSTSKCPICTKTAAQKFRPFCSKRCADVDLHRWLNGHYAIPVVEEDGSITTDPVNDNFEDQG